MLAEFRHPGHGDQSVHAPRKGNGIGGGETQVVHGARQDLDSTERIQEKVYKESGGDPAGYQLSAQKSKNDIMRKRVDEAQSAGDKKALTELQTLADNRKGYTLERIAKTPASEHSRYEADFNVASAQYNLIGAIIKEMP
jgi:hypothetical protein